MLRRLLLTLLAPGCPDSFTKPGRDSETQAALPVSEVAGMTGIGRTVFTEHPRRGVQGAHRLASSSAAGVMGPRRNLILARLEGGPLAETRRHRSACERRSASISTAVSHWRQSRNALARQFSEGAHPARHHANR